MFEKPALTIVVLTGLYLCGLAVAAFFRPDRATRFLLGFASSARAHYAELFVRMVAGLAFVVGAPRMYRSGIFSVFGWVLLVTTACMFLLPWKWHQRFAQQAVPQATRFNAMLGLGSLVFGGLILAAVLAGRDV